MKLIDKDALVAEIERLIKKNELYLDDNVSVEVRYQKTGAYSVLCDIRHFLDTLKVKEVDLKKEYKDFVEEDPVYNKLVNGIAGKAIAKHFFELGLKAQHDNWKVVDNINPPQSDKNKIYCVFTKDRYILATVINHPKDEELLQWKCTEFPFHRYDMCEGDKYMQIV